MKWINVPWDKIHDLSIDTMCYFEQKQPFDYTRIYDKVSTVVRESLTLHINSQSGGTTFSYEDTFFMFETAFDEVFRRAHNLRALVPNTFSFFTSNKGLERCFKCNCKTEERRDFSDMSIREMCPRCKV